MPVTFEWTKGFFGDRRLRIFWRGGEWSWDFSSMLVADPSWNERKVEDECFRIVVEETYCPEDDE